MSTRRSRPNRSQTRVPATSSGKEIQEVTEAGRIHIETIAPRGVHGSYEVRYAVRLPADAAANVSTTNGDLKAVGLAGTAQGDSGERPRGF